MKRSHVIGFGIVGAAAVLAAAGAVQSKLAGDKTDPLPRWSCRREKPPVSEVPAALLQQAGFSDQAQLRRFVDKDPARLHWTYKLVQEAMAPAERQVNTCLATGRVTGPGQVQRLDEVEVKFTWHLAADGRRAVAQGFAIAEPTGTSLNERSRRCLEEQIVGKSFTVVNPSGRDLLIYDGTFPFYRKLRIKQKHVGQTEGATEVRQSTGA
jgi:hypothetical protein